VSVDEHRIELGSAPVFYRSAGASNSPAPLYLHDVPTSSDDWIPFLERTGGIAPDLIGFGRSSKGINLDYSVAGLADFVEDLLAALHTEAPRLVGHGWGAAVALEVARRRPERTDRLVLIDPLPLGTDFAWPRLARIYRVRFLGELAMGSTHRWMLARALRRATVNSDAWSKQRIATIWKHFDQGTQRAILRLYRSVDLPGEDEAGEATGAGAAANRETTAAGTAANRETTAAGAAANRETTAAGTAANGEMTGAEAVANSEARSGAEVGRPPPVTAPTVVVWGEEDPWFPVQHAEAFAHRLPKARLERLAGAGHWPWLDRPELIEAIAAFLGAAA
jgi:pimeloyl-ACP methyl ester carboxylesterase